MNNPFNTPTIGVKVNFMDHPNIGGEDLFKHKLSHGFWMVTEAQASRLCGGQLPKPGYEKLVAYGGTHWWVARTPQSSADKGWVWSIRETKSWKLVNGVSMRCGDEA